MSRVVLRALPLLLVLWLSQGGTTEHRCNLGEYFYWPSKGNYSVCRPCKDQTFMNKTHHQETQCYPCSEVTNETAEYIVSNCTSEKNAIICPLDGYAHKVDDPTCQRIPGVCGPGGHLDPTSSNLCLMCSDDSYMHWKNHTNHDCYNCPVPDPNGHQTNREPCTKTQKSVIGCEDGYFNMNKNSSHGAQCHKCKSCSETEELKHVGRNCTQDSDTICCPRQNMTVEKGQCVSSTSSTEQDKEQSSGSPNNTTCEESQYLSVNKTTGHTSCKNCSDYLGKHLPESCHSVMKKDKDDDNAVIIAVSVVVPLVVIALFVFLLLYCYQNGKLPCKLRNNGSSSRDRGTYGPARSQDDDV